MKFGGNWNLPVNATQAQMDAYVAGKYNGDNGIRNTYSMLNRLNIAVIGNFEGPSVWLGSKHPENGKPERFAATLGLYCLLYGTAQYAHPLY